MFPHHHKATRIATIGAGLAVALVVAACSSTGSSSTASSPGSTGSGSAGSGSAGSGSAGSGSAGSGASGSGSAPTGDPIIIGQTAGLTGYMSVFDLPIQQGIKMAIEDINAKGGVLGRPLTLVTNNNETDPTKIQTAASEILDKGAQFVITSCDFDIGSPAARVVNAKSVIAMSCAGAPGFGVEDVGPLAYDINTGSPAEGAAIAEYVQSKGYTKPFVISDISLQFTQSTGESFIARWKDLGGTLAGSDTYQNGDASAASQISAIKQSGADVVIVESYPPGGATLLRQIRTAGINLPLIGNSAFDGTYWLESIPNLSDFTIPTAASMFGDDPRTEVNEFFQRIEKETGKPAASGLYPLAGYSMVQAYAEAIGKAGSTDTSAVEGALNSFDKEDLLIGPTTWTAKCHYAAPDRPYELVEYSNGKPSRVGEFTLDSIAVKPSC